jgi:hypothetical protein
MESIKWEELYLKLYAYTDQLLKKSSRFKKKTNSFLKDKQVEDYVCDSIEKYLSAPGKFDVNSGRSLLNYLKFHIIRSLVSNDFNSAENQLTIALPYMNENDDNWFVNMILPNISATFDENIDYEKIMEEIYENLHGDKIAKLIFNEVRVNGIPRIEFIKEYKISEKDFDNGMKRLKTVLKNIIKLYDYE